MKRGKHLKAKSDKSCSTVIEYCLVLLVFFICLAGAMFLPTSQCPDETGRRLLSDWILCTGTLPTGDEPATQLMMWTDLSTRALTFRDYSGYIDYDWGFSYALRPYLSSIVGAAFEKLAACFTNSQHILLAASRMCSVLAVTLCCFFCLRLGNRLFENRSTSVLFATVVCFLPQVVFLGMYQNNDALSLCAVSMVLYYLIEGYDLKWPVKSCVGLAVAFSVGLLSYYSVYGWLLMGGAFCILAVLTDKEIQNKGSLIGNRTALISGVCLLLAGWFFIRNACLHDGDFFGLESEAISRIRMQEQGYVLYPFNCYRDGGMSALEFLHFKNHEWLRMSGESFIGVFGKMVIYLPMLQYGIYYAVFLCAILLFSAVLLRNQLKRRNKLLLLMMLMSSSITVFLHFWHSYARDYQPQGRYVISIIFLLGFMIAYGMDRITLSVGKQGEECAAALHPTVALTVIWLLLFAWAFFGTMVKMIS